MKTALHHVDGAPLYESMDSFNFYRLRDSGFRQTSAVVLCLASNALMAVFFVFNLLEGHYHVLAALALGSLLPLFTLYRLARGKKASVSLFCSGLNFIALSTFMFMSERAPDSSALFWFMFVPPLVVFCLSRRLAMLLFLIFFFFLAVLLFPPQGAGFSNEFTLGFRAKFMASTILAFAFFWIVEYVRNRADYSLCSAIRRLERFAFTDPLTGIGNRRDFQNHLKWIQAQSERNGEPFSVALLDIDHFKRINDTYGHPVGDALLRHVAKVINKTLRETDRVFRWGGEEFAVIMPGVALEEAARVTERVRRRIAETPLSVCREVDITVTVSAGVDGWTKAADLDQVVGNADSKLYLAKKLGRNRVYAGSSSQAVEWFHGLRALPRMKKSPARALADFPMPMALPAHV